MPALNGIEEKYMHGYKVDNENEDTIFNDEHHLYINKKEGYKYISATTLIGLYEQPYDSDFWSMYKAFERIVDPEIWAKYRSVFLEHKRYSDKSFTVLGIDKNDALEMQKQILQEWENKKNESCTRGTKIHAEREEFLYDNGAVCLQKFGIGGTLPSYKGVHKLDAENGIFPEYFISWTSEDGILKIAGMSDIVIKNGDEVIIGDWKGLPLDTKLPTPNGWTTMKDVQVGDSLFDANGKITKVLHKSTVHHNPCYKIQFDNNDEIIADCDHKWKVYFLRGKKKKYTVMTTKQLSEYLDKHVRNSPNIPKIENPKPLILPDVSLPIDPYVLGVWLGDGSKSCGMLTQRKDSPIWTELRKRGYELGENVVHNKERENTESRTILGLSSTLKQLNLLNNKHIPAIYFRASYEQRLDLLRGLMDTDGYYHPKRKRFCVKVGYEWQQRDTGLLLSTLGIKYITFDTISTCGDKKIKTFDLCFSTRNFNPFLTRNQEIDTKTRCDYSTFRNIKSVTLVDTVPTQCIEVDSEDHTFLCTEKMIVTHNTNAEIKTKGYFDKKTKKTQCMRFPLNKIPDVNFYHYSLQLSLYMWLLQQQYPNIKCGGLFIWHIDHDGNETKYDCPYLKDEIEKMLKHYKKRVKIQAELDLNKAKKYE